MGRKRLAVVLLIFGAVAVLGAVRGASAHECPPDNSPCHTTPVQPDWRGGNYIPLFDIDRDCETEGNCEERVGHDSDGDGDIDSDDARYDAQRWRDECAQTGQEEANQFCIWADFGTSFFDDEGFAALCPAPIDESGVHPICTEPNEVHAGGAGSHCFLFEFAHQCEDHYAGEESEGVHDAHGGAAWVDACLAANPDSKYCDDGIEDTQVGVTVMDHNPCGAPIPIVNCIDEYHQVRPLDTDATQDQMEDSGEYIGEIADDPATYLCGEYGRGSYIDADNSTCHDGVNGVIGILPGG